MIKRTWSVSEDQFLIEKVKAGYSNRQIGDVLKRTSPSVDKRIQYLRGTKQLEGTRPFGRQMQKYSGLLTGLDAKIEQIQFPTFNDFFKNPYEDFMAVSDMHLPFFHRGLISKLFAIAEKFKIKVLYINGDFLNLDTFSSFDTADKGRGPLELELKSARLMLRALCSVFDKIYITSGNHETRMLKATKGALGMDNFFRMLSQTMYDPELGPGENKNAKIFVSTYRYAFVGDSWVVGHPDEYNRMGGDDPAKKTIKYRRNVISGHNHMLGITASSDGQYVGVDHGCACDPYKIEYYMKSFNNHPIWQNGFSMVRNHKPYLFSLKFTDWEYWLGKKKI